jgi:hypothetical protein
MTNRQFVALGVRLFCIWLAIYILRYAPAYWLLNGQQSSAAHDAAPLIIGTLVLVAIVIALWLFPLTVARKLLPRSALDLPTSLPTREQIEQAGFCLLGLWLLTQAIPSLVFEGMVFYLYTRPGSELGLRPQEYAALARALVELALAVWLLFGAKGLLGIVRWARTAGSGAGASDSPPAPNE